MEGKPFAERLVRLRKQQELTQSQLEERAGLAGSVVSRLECGKREVHKLRVWELQALATALRTTTDVLLGTQDPDLVFPLALQKLLIVPLIWRRKFQESLEEVAKDIGHLP